MRTIRNFAEGLHTEFATEEPAFVQLYAYDEAFDVDEQLLSARLFGTSFSRHGHLLRCGPNSGNGAATSDSAPIE